MSTGPGKEAQTGSLGRLLIVDDEDNMRHMLARMLAKDGYRIETAADGRQALTLLKRQHFDFILCDIKMPVMDGMAFLDAASSLLENTTVIMMSAYGTIDLAVEAMKKGAYDFISKPFKPDEVRMTIRKAEERERLKRENVQLKRKLHSLQRPQGFGALVGKSRAMQQVFELARKVAAYPTTVLVSGESGTGKELMARAIHDESPRRDKPFVAVNCGAIPANLLESELFGHEKGAFTGAGERRKGLFAQADGGTLFLDEVGELPLDLQVKLLRVLQEGEVRPVGGNEPFGVDVRVIAATARNLEHEVAQGRFRSDLYFRLNVMPVVLPPLRRRTEDIPLLCDHFIKQFNARMGRAIDAVDAGAMRRLLAYRWPGNVRQLENAIERAMVLSSGPVLTEEDFHLDDSLFPAQQRQPHQIFEGYSLKVARKVLEKELIRKALDATGGNRSKAARLLEISHPSLLSKIKAYGLDD